jgi:hypothetical protein
LLIKLRNGLLFNKLNYLYIDQQLYIVILQERIKLLNSYFIFLYICSINLIIKYQSVNIGRFPVDQKAGAGNLRSGSENEGSGFCRGPEIVCVMGARFRNIHAKLKNT